MLLLSLLLSFRVPTPFGAAYLPMGATSSRPKPATKSATNSEIHRNADRTIPPNDEASSDRAPKASTVSEDTADSKSTAENATAIADMDPSSTTAKKKVQVLSVDAVETYEDDCNQTGLSEYEMNKMDKFYHAPHRRRGRAYLEMKEADIAKKEERRAKKEQRRSKRRSKGKQDESEAPAPNTVAFAIQNAKRLGVLNLSKMELQIVPEEVFDAMPGTARIFNISHNELQALEPRMFDYVLVQRLIANHNRLASIHPGIQRMVALKKLDLAHNLLSIVPDCFASLRHLELVDLSGNKLEALPPSFAQLDLTDLNLSKNAFKVAPPQIESMTGLIELDLSENEIETVPEAWMSLTRLISLKLDKNKITDFPNVILQLCADLITLSLRGNPIKMNVLEAKDAFALFEERRGLHLRRQVEAGNLKMEDLEPADR